MSFSLYGALPPSKSDKGADNSKKETSSSQLSGLYSSLPAPESGSTSFQSDSQQPSRTNLATTTTTTTTRNQPNTSTTSSTQPTKPAGKLIVM